MNAIEDIRRILYRVEPEKLEEMKTTAEELMEYTGTYEFSPDFRIVITVKDGKIFGQATAQPSFEMFKQRKDLFFLKVVDAKLQFNRDATNKIESVTLLQDGYESPGKKIK